MEISGIVRAGGPQQHLSDVKVTLFMGQVFLASTHTSQEGHFELHFEELPHYDNLLCKFEKEGFSPYERSILDFGKVLVELSPITIPVRFFVSDENNTGVQGAKIVTEIEGNGIGSDHTNFDGELHLSLPNSFSGKILHYQVTKDGWEPSTGKRGIPFEGDQREAIVLKRKTIPETSPRWKKLLTWKLGVPLAFTFYFFGFLLPSNSLTFVAIVLPLVFSWIRPLKPQIVILVMALLFFAIGVCMLTLRLWNKGVFDLPSFLVLFLIESALAAGICIFRRRQMK